MDGAIEDFSLSPWGRPCPFQVASKYFILKLRDMYLIFDIPIRCGALELRSLFDGHPVF